MCLKVYSPFLSNPENRGTVLVRIKIRISKNTGGVLSDYHCTDPPQCPSGDSSGTVIKKVMLGGKEKLLSVLEGWVTQKVRTTLQQLVYFFSNL